MFAKIRENKDRLFTIIVGLAIIIYLIVSGKDFFLQNFIYSSQNISYVKTEYVLSRCKDYLTENDQFIKENGQRYCITLKQLRDANYISGKVRNPNTLEVLPDSFEIEAVYENGDFNVSYNEYCN